MSPDQSCDPRQHTGIFDDGRESSFNSQTLRTFTIDLREFHGITKNV